MTRVRPMSKTERAALADALRHMRVAGVRHVDLVRIAGAKVRLVSEPVARRPQ